MSWPLLKFARTRKVGADHKKSVLLHIAAGAGDDGTGIYQSKSEMARVLELCRNTIITVLKEFVRRGVIEKVGKRKTPNGYVDEYRIVIAGLKALPPISERHQDAELSINGARVVNSTCVQDAQTPAHGLRTNNKRKNINEMREGSSTTETTKGSETLGKRKEMPNGVDKLSEKLKMIGSWLAAGKPVSPTLVTPPEAREMLAFGLATERQLRDNGIVF